MTLTLTLIILAIILTAAIAISALRRADKAINALNDLKAAIDQHAAKVWGKLDELERE